MNFNYYNIVNEALSVQEFRIPFKATTKAIGNIFKKESPLRIRLRKLLAMKRNELNKLQLISKMKTQPISPASQVSSAHGYFLGDPSYVKHKLARLDELISQTKAMITYM